MGERRRAGGQAVWHCARHIEHFVPGSIDGLHVDLQGWNEVARRGRPVLGGAPAVRALPAFIERRHCVEPA